MFSKATAKFVRQVDPDGSLIHVSRLNNSHKLVPMAVVAKRNRFWFWQRPKYQPTYFTFSDLLLGDNQLIPDVSESEFLTYQGKFGDTLSGKLNATTGSVEVNVEGKGSSKLTSSFGTLKREELNVKKLQNDSKDRLVDLRNKQVQQLQKRAEVLAVLKERILTTSPCSITETQHKQLGCLGLLGLSSVQVSVKDSNTVNIDSDVSMEIPPGTVIAYSILELEIKRGGQYELCLHPGTCGSFETDSGTSSPSRESLNNLCVVDGLEWNGEKVLEKAPLSALRNELQELEVLLPTLAELPESDRCALFKKLLEILRDRAALSCLEEALEDRCRGEAPLAVQEEEVLEAVLDLLRTGPFGHSEDNDLTTPAHLTAAHLLVSAMEVLSDETLILLSECQPDFLKAVDKLLFQLRESEEPLSLQSLPSILQGNKAFHLAKQLLQSTNVMLRRDADTLQALTGDKPGFFPIALCVTVRGLSLLCHGQDK